MNLARVESESSGFPITVTLPERFTALLPYLQRELSCDQETVIIQGVSALLDLIERVDQGQYLVLCESESTGESCMPNCLSADYLMSKYRCCRKQELTFLLTRNLGATLHHLEEKVGARNLTEAVACAIDIVAWYLASAERGAWVVFFAENLPHFVYFVPKEANASSGT